MQYLCWNLSFFSVLLQLVNLSFFKLIARCFLILRSEEEIVNCLMLKTVSKPAYEFIRQNQVLNKSNKLSEIKAFWFDWNFSYYSSCKILIVKVTFNYPYRCSPFRPFQHCRSSVISKICIA